MSASLRRGKYFVQPLLYHACIPPLGLEPRTRVKAEYPNQLDYSGFACMSGMKTDHLQDGAIEPSQSMPF